MLELFLYFMTLLLFFIIKNDQLKNLKKENKKIRARKIRIYSEVYLL